jgi:hypothetical protein
MEERIKALEARLAALPGPESVVRARVDAVRAELENSALRAALRGK